MRLRGVLTAGFALLFSLATGVTAAQAAPTPAPTPAPSSRQDPNDPPNQVEVPEVSTLAAPNFQLPFPCGQRWSGNSSASSAHRSYEIDFNRGSTAGADLGDTVVAAAAGTVVISAHQGSTNGYGNLVKIDHGGGWTSYYAHLNSRSVSAGARVSQGQKIGTVGNTSKPGNNISPHLHYEVREGSGYPGNIRRAVFNGVTFGYPSAAVTSNNTCGGATNPYTPQEVCGSGYKVIDSAALGSAGTVYLLYNSGNGYNCVTTIKKTSLGKATATTAYLEVAGRSRITDSGNFSYYAGPVRASAAGKCVKWGGKAGSSTYNSPSEHCGS
ncbi:peptidoglycan DD-metalloendopeptidase family protein [Nonomuraea phyllanthi]|uniref:M23 family metallopeptidase n=1 Tax=Nonomuraea phyllanthi TaxID=2219224 RepID=UPI0012931D3A|nr:M23 family metallopeptidase [Nonomuraea phyllanthi]QFY10460.1 peptidoglycan DD-metalloendopeptidase family protein [Nonomuraea phyllanthi]